VCCYEALLVDICLLSPIRMWWTNMQMMLVCIQLSEGPIPGVRQVVVDDDRTGQQFKGDV
jgi:hypothetical protein